MSSRQPNPLKTDIVEAILEDPPVLWEEHRAELADAFLEDKFTPASLSQGD